VSNLEDLVDFINNAGVVAVVTYPEIGVKSGAMPVLYARASGSKRLGTAVNAQGEEIDAVFSTVDEIIPVEGGFHVRVDGDFDQTTVIYEHAKGRMLEHWNAMAEAVDDSLDDIVTKINVEVGSVPTPISKPTKNFEFARWSAFDVDAGKQMPYGVLMVIDGDLRAFPFPTSADAENDASTFDGHKISLEDAGKLADQMTVISAPELLRAFDSEDARDRALYSYAKDYYAETGRSLLQ
jgi:hypothetical protein